MSAKDTVSAALDLKIRDAGWHFMWIADAYTRSGFGRTAISAIDNAVIHALKRVKKKFNAAELESVRVSRYPGFQIAKIKLCARHIQEQPSLGLFDEVTIRHLAVH